MYHDGCSHTPIESCCVTISNAMMVMFVMALRPAQIRHVILVHRSTAPAHPVQRPLCPSECVSEFIDGASSSASDCDDGDACNGTETCSDGQCQNGTPLVCDDGNACNGLETCQNGQCQNGTPLNCNDGDACNGTETCSGGQCQAVLHSYVMTVTSVMDSKHVATDSARTGHRSPVMTEMLVTGSRHGTSGCQPGTPLQCNDGNDCNGEEYCSNGQCQNGPPLNCDDGNTCTVDSCLVKPCFRPTTPYLCYCDHEPIDGCCTSDSDCDDGDPCNGSETV